MRFRTVTDPMSQPAPPPALAARTALFAAYSLCLGLVSASALAALVHLSLTDPSSSHVVLIPLIALALIYRGRKAIFSTVGFAWPGGLALIGAGLVCFVAASLYEPVAGLQDALTLQVASLVMLWVGGFLLIYGRPACRAGLFPLCFLALTIPIPAVLLGAAIRILTTASSEVLAGLFTIIGTHYHRDGAVFALSGVSIRIADECSGIRSTIGLIIAGLLVSHMHLSKARSRALFIAALLPMAVLKNAIRIATLTLLAMHVDPGFLTGRLHQQGGILFFLVTLGLLAPVLALLRRSEQFDYRRRIAGTVPQQV